jgi:phospholipid/cholesterol/gamma-HCH transport system permease protein
MRGAGMMAVTSAGERRAAADGAQVAAERDREGKLVVRLAGTWTLEDGMPDLGAVEQALDERPPPASLAFDMQELHHWDSGVLAFVAKVEDLAKSHQVKVDRGGLPEPVQRLLTIAEAVPEKQGARPAETADSWIARVGLAAMRAWDQAVSAVTFLGEATLALGRLLTGRARFRWRDFAVIVQEAGIEALPIVTLINFLVGMIIAFVGAVQLQKFGASIYVADLVTIATARELGCLMTAVIMAGRTGSGFAAQLGTMQVNQEVEALETMSLPPMEFLVLPRLLALTLMMPLLCIYADVVAWFGGAFVAVGMLDLNPTLFWQESKQSVALTDISLGISKSLVFGIIIAICGCMQGIHAGKNAAAVGRAATSAVVLSIVWIVVADGVFAVLCNVLGI